MAPHPALALLCVMLAGGCGAGARYLLSTWIDGMIASAYPWGITVVNVLGSLFFGILIAVAGAWLSHEKSTAFLMYYKLIFLTGFLGAFTTFSTFTYDTVRLFEQTRYDLAVANLLIQNVVGVIAVCVGLWVGRA